MNDEPKITDADQAAAEEIMSFLDEHDRNDLNSVARLIARHRIERDKRLVEALRKLEGAERNYREIHDAHGGGKAVFAWDNMRHHGNSARSLLTELGYTHEE